METDGTSIIYEVPITENQINTPIYCSGAALAASNDGTVHVVLFVDQPTVSGRFERVANLRIIMPDQSWAQTLQVVDRALRAKSQGGGGE